MDIIDKDSDRVEEARIANDVVRRESSSSSSSSSKRQVERATTTLFLPTSTLRIYNSFVLASSSASSSCSSCVVLTQSLSRPISSSAMNQPGSRGYGVIETIATMLGSSTTKMARSRRGLQTWSAPDDSRKRSCLTGSNRDTTAAAICLSRETGSSQK
jgi:hypothetical protein